MDIIDPMSSSYSLAKQASVESAELPHMDMERVLPRQQSTGLSRGIQQLGTPNVFVDSGNNQIIVVRNNINRVLMGDQPTFGEGFYVTKPGIDVVTAKSNDDFTFNSNQNVFKIVKTEIVNILVSSIPASVLTIPHNLGFAPIPFAFVVNASDGLSPDSSNIPLPTWLSATIDLVTPTINFELWGNVTANKESFSFVFLNSLGTTFGPINFRYYLTQETSGSSEE